MLKNYALTRPSGVASALLILVLSGCASFSKDGGLDAVSSMTGERTGQPVQFSKPGDADRAAVNELLAKPLDRKSVV